MPLQRVDQAIDDFGPDRDHALVHVRKIVHIHDVELVDSVDCHLVLRRLVLKKRSYLRTRVVLAGEDPLFGTAAATTTLADRKG